ncbi:ATP-binding protein [Amycolatopsis sp., V23-08]|uniref:ATP-binding protein n=1 Tax=Amycolatopsis heterodermiae TaxID=3110235 RepID=A0ABU5RLQ0_9PSEU|nr:ATP-binding protein [Amycolatopsis sp., V23-08]MEA5367223.1 ATP-binding protein [Amycolatopsis sp., V23-08]
MEARTHVVTLNEDQARIIDIRADLGVGDATLHEHGLNSKVSRETRDRVRAAIRNSGLSWPEGVVHLTSSTAHPRTDVDLAAAAAALLVIGAVPARRLTTTALIGELGLDGTVRPVPDVRTRAIAAAEARLTHLVVPAANAHEVGDIPGLTTIPVACLDDLVSWLRGGPLRLCGPNRAEVRLPRCGLPKLGARLAPTAVRAAALAAAGGHPILHVATPGTPVLLLPRLIRALMADLTDTEALEVGTWHFLASEPWPDNTAPTRPPGVSLRPDDTIAAIAGSLSRPGLLTLAHRGVVTVEDFPGFPAAPSRCCVRRWRTARSASPPREVASRARPGHAWCSPPGDCLCGSVRPEDCRCTPTLRARYLARIPLWLLDRVDLFVRDVIVAEPEPSLPSLESLRDSVARARERARYRWGAAPGTRRRHRLHESCHRPSRQRGEGAG